jgi:hypothetical protein
MTLPLRWVIVIVTSIEESPKCRRSVCLQRVLSKYQRLKRLSIHISPVRSSVPSHIEQQLSVPAILLVRCAVQHILLEQECDRGSPEFIGVYQFILCDRIPVVRDRSYRL